MPGSCAGDVCRGREVLSRAMRSGSCSIRQSLQDGEERQETFRRSPAQAAPEKSGPVLTRLLEWGVAEENSKRIEPASGLGKAVAYLKTHWVSDDILKSHLEPIQKTLRLGN